MDDKNPEVTSNSIRYQGKAVDDPEWIAEFLANQETGVLGLVDDNSPHLVTQLFVYGGSGSILMHGAQAGRAYDIIESGKRPRVSFTTSEMGRFIPDDEPVNFTVEYASVVAHGTIDLLTARTEKRQALEQVMKKFAPHLTVGTDYERMTEQSIDRTAVYRLDVDSWSGKQGLKDSDYSGAYNLDSVQKSN